jgi:hypothetical protein
MIVTINPANAAVTVTANETFNYMGGNITVTG